MAFHPDVLDLEVADSSTAKDRLETTLNSITDGYYALDSKWCFIGANRVAEEHFKRPVSDLLGRNIWVMTGMDPESYICSNCSARGISSGEKGVTRERLGDGG